MNCEDLKKKIVDSKEYKDHQNRSKWIYEIQDWFMCLPRGTYQFKGRLWTKYYIKRYLHVAEGREYVEITLKKEGEVYPFTHSSTKYLKWIINHKDKVMNSVRIWE